MQAAKKNLRDLRSLRERYNRILEEQVIRPLQSDLQDLRSELQTRSKSLTADGSDATAERATQAEMQRIDRVSQVVNAAATRMDDVNFDILERIFEAKRQEGR